MNPRVTRRAVIAGIGTASLAGCLGDGQGGSGNAETSPTTDGATQTTDQQTPAGPGPPTAGTQLPLPMDPASLREEAVSGGPPKDGIPALDDPKFVSGTDASDWLDPADPVFGIAAGSEVKAYPQIILVSHEICNDVVDGTPLSITYCPLTGTAMGFERGDTTFGVSGRLVNNNVIMYDRGTETWWPQILATSIPGPWNGSPETSTLREHRVIWTTWERWSDSYPDTQVLSRDTGFARNYASDPYGSYKPRSGYYAPDASPLFAPLFEDDRLQPKRVVIGTRTNAGATAFDKPALRETKIIRGELGGTAVVAVYEPDLDTGYVFRNPDGLEFTYRDGQVADDTGETYPPDSLPLEGILAFDAMWFAWSGFYPDTTLYD